MTKKTILRELGRFAQSIEMRYRNEDGILTMTNHAIRPISGKHAGRILNNQAFRDIIATTTGIMIMADERDVGADITKIKYRKYKRDKKYVVAVVNNYFSPEEGESMIRYATIEEVGHDPNLSMQK